MDGMAPEVTSVGGGRPGWQARLSLECERVAERTVLVRRSHEGPLCVQRPLYTDGDSACQLILLHPPGGLAGGDELQVDVRAFAGAHVLLTTPAAGKLYRSAGRPCAQRVQLHAEPGSRLEWLPQENIVYDGAFGALHTRIDLEGDARLLAAEVVCFGRPVCGERFERGLLSQRLEVYRDGAPMLLERARYVGGGALLKDSYGLGGAPVIGTLVCVAGPRSDALVERVRQVLASAAAERAGCTDLGAALVCRYVGPSVEQAHAALRAAHGVLREQCLDAAAITPRIFLT